MEPGRGAARGDGGGGGLFPSPARVNKRCRHTISDERTRGFGTSRKLRISFPRHETKIYTFLSWFRQAKYPTPLPSTFRNDPSQGE